MRDARRPGAQPAAGPAEEFDVARKLAQLEAVLARLVSTTAEQGERLAALETLIPAISEALGSGSATT